MSDAIDEARAELIGWFVRCCKEQVCDHHTYRDCEAEMRAAADRYALAYVRAAHQLACHSPCLTPGNCKFDGLFARLEGGSHAD